VSRLLANQSGVGTASMLLANQSGVGIPAGTKAFHFLQDSHPDSYPKGKRMLPYGLKLPGREADQPPESSAEIRTNEVLYLHHPFMPLRSVPNQTYLSSRIAILRHACAPAACIKSRFTAKWVSLQERAEQTNTPTVQTPLSKNIGLCSHLNTQFYSNYCLL